MANPGVVARLRTFGLAGTVLPRRLQRIIGKLTQGRLRPTFEQQVLRGLLEPGDVVYDVGANVGEVTRYAARLAGPRGRVFAFEPVLSTYGRLRRVIECHRPGRAPVVPLPFGLGAADELQTIRMPVTASELASLADQADAWTAAYGRLEIQPQHCLVFRLDGLIRRLRLPWPQLVKIDVEGAELLVLRGATEVLASARPLLHVEIFGPWERPFGYTPWDVLSYLRRWSYEFLFACPLGLVAHDPSANQPTPPAYRDGYNVLAFRPDTHARRIARLDALFAGKARALGRMSPAPLPNV